jgi:hypothetical protein
MLDETKDTDQTDVAPGSGEPPDVAPDEPKTKPKGKAKEEFHRPDAIYFVGELLPNGEPAEHLAGYGIPATDLFAGERVYHRLTDDQVKFALDSKLYRRTKPAQED